MKHLLLPLFLLLSLQTAFGQFSWNAELNLKGMASTEEDQLPFWMQHNQRGRIGKNTNFAGWMTGRGLYTFQNNSVLEVGAGALGRDGEGDDLFVDELYAHYETRSWSFTAGRKQQEELYNGLSASNRSILWSLNARPLPGLQLKTKRPIFLVKNFGFEAAWEEYLMEKNRFVNNARLHHKSLLFVYSSTDRKFKLKAGLQHFVQWGGDSPMYGRQPHKLDDYLKIITGQGGSENATEGEQLNALGNHLGGYEIYLYKQILNFKVELFYNHLFEDGSGQRLGNTPDGRYGLFVDLGKKEKLINSFVYEFYYTKHQSHTTTGTHKWDNYFNNFLYRSGWTYKNYVLGAPFFQLNYYDELGSPGQLRIANNNFLVHHFGLEGSIFNKHYKLLISYRNNYGHFNLNGDKHFLPDDPNWRYEIPRKALSIYTNITILDSFLTIDLAIGSDITSKKINAGIMTNLKYFF